MSWEKGSKMLDAPEQLAQRLDHTCTDGRLESWVNVELDRQVWHMLVKQMIAFSCF